MDDRIIYLCDEQNEDKMACCMTCVHCFVTPIWGDYKCEHKNHVTNTIPNGYVCKDYKPVIPKKVITENIDGGIVDDNA